MYFTSSITPLILVVASMLVAASRLGGAERFAPKIPRTWDAAELATSELPLADPKASPVHVSTDYYYSIPIRDVYKSYPIYRPDREPSGYFEWIKQQEPEIVFDARKLITREDWVKAGELVFEAANTYLPLERSRVRDLNFYNVPGVPVTSQGIMPFRRYVIRQKGKVEVADLTCATCHTRVMPDGTTVKGAQGNFRLNATVRPMAREEALRFFNSMFGAPWLGEHDPMKRLERMSPEDITATRPAVTAGVIARHGTSPYAPANIPDIIGVEERRYLDHTGLVRHRSIGDLMRYAALNQGMDFLSSYGNFIPNGPHPKPQTLGRYSDEQLYALSLYVYSLRPPVNPNMASDLSRRGANIFRREGCVECHTPPLYTNNKLTLAEGGTDNSSNPDVMQISVGTDPTLARWTRRGTGYYKVPSLKGVWYRGPFEHSGSVATLEDWFDVRRLREDYVPTGFVGHGVAARPVKGHEFGLKLSPEDKAALIAFLKIL